ncbi:hypothetical protein GCM10011571_28640 [Marinithermofilum abyssi]|uniref:Uncharacterized protein n=1 Tax=Marinithermofilum abyssi TaxID=1571185 RepID=A0A8J2VG13_9BACL|nr:hypothetical protein [Marinithermofilum abyssi]GGE24760.1 hypothetical protein GCM10011571_28640 [Marinithermofilum abyssi]
MPDFFNKDVKEKWKSQAKQFLEKRREDMQKLWTKVREEQARREREKEGDYAAEFRYQDEEMDFIMLISFEEAEIYEKAKKKLKEVRKIHSDPKIRKQWESKKYLSLHDHFTEQIEYYFQRRKEDPVAMERAIRYCKRQIYYAPVAAKAYRMDPTVFSLPEHPGYDRLITMYEERKNWTEALRLCQQAAEQGWQGDWSKRYNYLEEQRVRAVTTGE